MRVIGQEGASNLERRTLLMGNGTGQVYEFSLYRLLSECVHQLQFVIETQDALTAVIENRSGKLGWLSAELFRLPRIAKWDDQGMVIQVYACPDPATLFKDPMVGCFFPIEVRPFVMLEVLTLFIILGVIVAIKWCSCTCQPGCRRRGATPVTPCLLPECCGCKHASC